MAPTKVKKVLIPNTETLRRGIPRVTLEGGQGDWDSLLKKLERLKEYGIHLLYPVVSRFSKSFGAPDSPENWEFWKKVVHGEGDGGRSSKLSGWITAFCVFAFEGKWRIPGLETVSLFLIHYRSDLLSSIMTASAWKEESRHATFQSFLVYLRSVARGNKFSYDHRRHKIGPGESAATAAASTRQWLCNCRVGREVPRSAYFLPQHVGELKLSGGSVTTLEYIVWNRKTFRNNSDCKYH
jgi:hypothetical protein